MEVEDNWEVWALSKGIWYRMPMAGTQEECLEWFHTDTFKCDEYNFVNVRHNARTSEDVQRLVDEHKKKRPLKQLKFKWD